MIETFSRIFSTGWERFRLRLNLQWKILLLVAVSMSLILVTSSYLHTVRTRAVIARDHYENAISQTSVLTNRIAAYDYFSSIEDYIGRHSADYYAVLAEVGQGTWNPQRDPLPWIKFCLTAHYRQANSLLRRLAEMRSIWDQLEALAKGHRLNLRVVNALAEAALGYKVRNPSYRRLAEVSNQVAKYDLKTLADLGLLIPVGERRGRFYERGEVLTQIRNSVRTPRTEEVDPFAEPDTTSSPQQGVLPGFASRPNSG